jgi:hypothetical protein
MGECLGRLRMLNAAVAVVHKSVELQKFAYVITTFNLLKLVISFAMT